MQDADYTAGQRTVLDAVAAHANAIDKRTLALMPLSNEERDGIDNALYNAVRAIDPEWWDRTVPGLNAMFATDQVDSPAAVQASRDRGRGLRDG